MSHEIILDGTAKLDIQVIPGDDESGSAGLVIRAGDVTVRVQAGRTADDAGADLAWKLGRAADQARQVQEEYDSSPQPFDAWIVPFSSRLRGAEWHVNLEGVSQGSYPRREFAVYQLARAMAETGSFPAAWIEGENWAPVSIDAEVRAFHDEGGTGLLPLPGARFAPGDAVTVPGEDWKSWTVIFDYGDLGVHLHTEGDESVTIVTAPGNVRPRGHADPHDSPAT